MSLPNESKNNIGVGVPDIMPQDGGTALYDTLQSPLLTSEWLGRLAVTGPGNLGVVVHSYPTPGSENGNRTVRLVPHRPGCPPEERLNPWDNDETVFAEFRHDSSIASSPDVLRRFLDDHPDAGIRLGYFGMRSTQLRLTPEGRPYDSWVSSIKPSADKVSRAARANAERAAELNRRLDSAKPVKRIKPDRDEIARKIKEEKPGWDKPLVPSIPVVERRKVISDRAKRGESPESLAKAFGFALRYILRVINQ